MKKITRVICVVVFCLVAMMGMSSKCRAENSDLYSDGRTSLLMHMNGEPGNNSFFEETGKTVKLTGSPQISNSNSKFGNGSLYIPSTGNYIKTDSSDDFSLSGDFTWESWIYMSDIPDENKLHMIYSTVANNGFGVCIYNGKFGLYKGYVGPVGYFDASIPTGEWLHLAFTRESGFIRMFINGTLVGTITDTTVFQAGQVYVASESGSSSYKSECPMYFDELRLIKGKAIYTENFTTSKKEYCLEPENLHSNYENGKVELSWDATVDAQHYLIKRSETENGPYTVIGQNDSNWDTIFIDTTVEKGKIYYYVVSAVTYGLESHSSNEVAVNIPSKNTDYDGNSAILEIVMTNGTIKEYSLTADELEAFLTWYDNRSDGIEKSYYRIPKKGNVKPFLSRKEYLSFNKIYSFEVKDYNE
ncbi:MAG: LamG-like jellyroll fold domain-containing protein [Velocimicrobium sp.]